MDAESADVTRAVHWQLIGAANLSFPQAVAELETFGAAVDLSKIQYLPYDQNSNSFAIQAVSVLSLPRPVPVWVAHGSETVLIPGY
jgi:hypothetical protein